MKKVLTGEGYSCIIHQVAASKTLLKGLEWSDMILENDTESRRTRDCDFHESQSKQRQSIRLMSFELEGDFKVQYRI